MPLKPPENKTHFTRHVLRVISSIPTGQTLSYQQVARLAGSPKAFRAVGNILSKNFKTDIPCHRVVKSNGSIGRYNRGLDLKKRLLEEEAKPHLALKQPFIIQPLHPD